MEEVISDGEELGILVRSSYMMSAESCIGVLADIVLRIAIEIWFDDGDK